MTTFGPLTVLLFAVAAVYATIAISHFTLWARVRSREHLLFAAMAVVSGASTVAMSFVYRAESTAAIVAPYRLSYVAQVAWLIAMTWFAESYARAGPSRRRWAIALSAIGLVGLLVNQLLPNGAVLARITGLREGLLFGQRAVVPIGEGSPWRHVTDVAQVGFIFFIVDGALRLRRQGSRRRAIFLGLVIAPCIVAFGVYGALMRRGVVSPPYLDGFVYLLVVLAFSQELTADVVKRAAQARQIVETETRWRALLETVDLLVVGLDRTGAVDYVNPHFLAVTGYAEGDVLGQPWFDRFLVESERAAALREFDRLLEAEGDPHSEALMRIQGGGTLLVRWLGLPLRDASGMASGVLCMGEDLTGRRSADERFRLVVEASPSAIVLVDDRGQILLANVQTEALFGYARQELIGHSVEILVPDRMRAAHPRHRDAFFAEPEARPMGAGRELFAKRKDGSEILIEIGLTPIPTREGLLVLTAIVDITERKRTEEQLTRQRQELAHVTRVSTMGELSTSLAHELNQPLTAILSNSQAAQMLLAIESPDLVEVREILEDIVHDTRRAGGVIRQMRALVKKETLDFSPVEIGSVLRDVLPLVHSDAVGRNCRLSLALAADLPRVRGDRVQLQQVTLNLLLNAFDAMAASPSEQREVVIGAVVDGPGHVRVDVRDCGPGFAEDQFGSIFEPFYTTKRDGLGMGLPISRSIVEAHGGRLWAENNPELGATVSFTLPVAP